MLPRAAVRAWRARPALAVPRASPIASTSQLQWRSYANSSNRNKPPQNQTWKRSDPIKISDSNKAKPLPVHPAEQPEFGGPAAPEQNTAPNTESQVKDRTWKRSDPIKFDGPETSTPNPVHPAEQPEFDGPTNPARNTAPETDQDPTEAPAQPQKPLPDLRQGIPSTFGAEFAQAQARNEKHVHDPNNITEDPSKEPASGGVGGRGTGELPKSAFETSTDRRRNKVANWSYAIALGAGVAGTVYMGRNWDDEAEERANPEAPSGWGLGLMYARAKARINGQMGYYTEPTFPKLLPDKSALGDQAPPLTLVLSLEDLLIHSEWTTKKGWRTAKRPGLDYFLRYLSQYYELVIFTSVKSMDADPIIRKLDPFRIVMWPLFREATRYDNGEYVKVGLQNSMQLQENLTSIGSFMSQPRPFQNHHHRHRPCTRKASARERDCAP
jgi:import inner membrane translocase subunit TIM50